MLLRRLASSEDYSDYLYPFEWREIHIPGYAEEQARREYRDRLDAAEDRRLEDEARRQRAARLEDEARRQRSALAALHGAATPEDLASKEAAARVLGYGLQRLGLWAEERERERERERAALAWSILRERMDDLLCGPMPGEADSAALRALRPAAEAWLVGRPYTSAVLHLVRRFDLGRGLDLAFVVAAIDTSTEAT